MVWENKLMFPKNGEGYETLHATEGQSKELLLVSMPPSGFGVNYLRSVLGQAKGYLRPSQWALWRPVKESMQVLRRYENECYHYISQMLGSGSWGEGLFACRDGLVKLGNIVAEKLFCDMFAGVAKLARSKQNVLLPQWVKVLIHTALVSYNSCHSYISQTQSNQQLSLSWPFQFLSFVPFPFLRPVCCSYTSTLRSAIVVLSPLLESLL